MNAFIEKVDQNLTLNEVQQENRENSSAIKQSQNSCRAQNFDQNRQGRGNFSKRWNNNNDCYREPHQRYGQRFNNPQTYNQFDNWEPYQQSYQNQIPVMKQVHLKTRQKRHSESADPGKALVSWLCSNEQKREISD